MLKIIICLWLASFGFFLEMAECARTFPPHVAMVDDEEGDDEQA